MLQMLGGIGDRQVHAGRQGLHAAFALGQMLKNLKPVRMAKGAGDGCELREELLLWAC
jgi:hypothetical protein